MTVAAVVLLASQLMMTPAWFPGEITLPPQYTIRKTGTIDSVMGEITGPKGFVIGFDIGIMAGIHMHESRKAECEWFIDHTIGGQRAFTGLRVVKGKRRITTTTYSEPLTSSGNPANFWADVRDEKDVALFLTIVMTYQPRKPSPRR